MRSVQSLQECFVCFENTTERTLNVIWIDYHGKEQFHMSVRPHAKAKINTFRSHPWIFRDHETGEQMHHLHHPMYLPMPCYVRNPRSPRDLMPARQHASIHFPLRTLRESCMWQVLRSLRVTTLPGTITRTAIDSLEVPGILKKDLVLLLEAIEVYKRNFAPIVLFRV